jgi:hypothetical protein
MDGDVPGNQKRIRMPPVCAIFLKVTKTDGEERQDVARRDGRRRWEDDQDCLASLTTQRKRIWVSN